MRSRVKAAIGALAVLWFSLAAPAHSAPADCPAADTEALGWLERMSRSHQELSYRGVVTLQRGDDLQVLRVVHNVRDGRTEEHLTRLTGQDARVTRAHPQDCLHPGHTLLRTTDGTEVNICHLARHYRFQVEDGERVAGRSTVRVSALPRDMYRYAHIFELDRDTGLLLRSLILARDERVLERVQFAELSIGDAPDTGGAAAVEHRADHPHPDQDPPAETVGLPWQPGWLPEGFTRTDSAAATHPRRTFTDGLVVFSVFLEPLREGIRPGEGLVREGSTASYTRGLVLAERPVLVTVIGEVPVNTARMVADGVRLEP